MWSRALDLACGFWSISEGKVMAALSAIPSTSDSKAKALKKTSKFSYKLLATCSRWDFK